MQPVDLKTLDELIALYGPDTSADYVGQVWTDTPFTATLGDIRRLLQSSQTWEKSYDTAGMVVVKVRGGHCLQDKAGQVVLVVRG